MRDDFRAIYRNCLADIDRIYTALQATAKRRAPPGR